MQLAAAMILRTIQNCLFVARLFTVKHETICTLSCNWSLDNVILQFLYRIVMMNGVLTVQTVDVA